jgi:hypothetical protein
VRRIQLLSEKIQTYAREIWSGGFIHEYPDKQAGDFIIKVICRQPPTAAMREISSVGEIGHQITVVIEMEASEPVETNSSAESEPKHSWTDVLAQAFAEFTHDPKFFALQAEMLTAALASAGAMNFVCGRAYRGDGTAGEMISFSQGQPTEETADSTVVAQARAFAQQLGLEFEYWFVTYTTVHEAEGHEESQLWVVAEGWKRGQNRGISIGQIFQRGDPSLSGEPQLIGIVPVDVFTVPVAAIPKPELKPSPRPDFPWRAMVALLAVVAMVVAGYFTYQKFLRVPRTSEPTPVTPITVPPTNVVTAPAPPPVVTTPLDLIIVQSAEYVAGKHTTNVTARVKELLHVQPAGFKPDTETLGIEPLAGRRKRLTVQYSYQGTNYNFNFPASKMLSVQSLIERTRSPK